MKCPHCSSDRVTDKDNFCGFCGKKLKKGRKTDNEEGGEKWTKKNY